jgi:molecular chaperone GrpE
VTSKHRGRSDEEPKVVIRDRRRIDPETGTPRSTGKSSRTAGVTTSAARPGAGADAADKSSGNKKTDVVEAPAADAKEVAELRSELDERTKDLQRVTAEYANYRKRVERDRLAVVEQATGAVLSTLLPILDDIDRARQHGDLNGAFAAVAEQLQSNLTKLGLTSFGESGDVFDPSWHEAVASTPSEDVTEPTCAEVLRRGYALGDRLLRAAMVAVAEPAEPSAKAEPAEDDADVRGS